MLSPMGGRDGHAPVAMAASVVLPDGTTVRIRPVSPDDEPLMVTFHAGLSPRSVFQRYFHLESLEQRTAHHRLALACNVDPAHGLALVAARDATAGPEIVAMGRLTFVPPADTAEMALLVVDRCQRLGVGSALMVRLLAAARARGIAVVRGDMLADNEAMRALVRRAGFTLRPVDGDHRLLRAELGLNQISKI